MLHTTFARRPVLRRPVLVSAFEGWNDAGEAASTALGFVANELQAEGMRGIDWRGVETPRVAPPDQERARVLLRGQEPNLRWRSFAEEVLRIATEFGVELLVTLGALLADGPPPRPVEAG